MPKILGLNPLPLVCIHTRALLFRLFSARGNRRNPVELYSQMAFKRFRSQLAQLSGEFTDH
eukprot:c18516_g1_i7 orf=151-333(+)